MKMKKIFYFALPLFLISFLLFSCKRQSLENSETSEKIAKDTCSYDLFELDTVDAICKAKYKNCATAKISFPIFNSSDSSINNFLNKETQQFILGKDEGNYYASIYDYIGEFFKENRAVKNEIDYDAASSEWSAEKSVTVESKIGKYISLTYNYFGYTGGAHENFYTLYKTFDLTTKKEIQISDLVDVKNEALLKIGEKYFRKDNAIADTSSLTDYAYFIFGEDENFEDSKAYGKFHFNNNFALTKQGILFHYNPYEIAPFAAGSPSVTIPYIDLQPFLKIILW